MTITKLEQHMTRQREWHQKAKETRTKFLRQNSKEVTPFSLSSSRSFIYLFSENGSYKSEPDSLVDVFSALFGHTLCFRLMNEME